MLGPRAVAGTGRIEIDYITISAVLRDREPAETEGGDLAGPELGLDLAVQIGFLAVVAGPDRPGDPSEGSTPTSQASGPDAHRAPGRFE